MTGRVPGTTIRERARHLRGISEQLAARFRASQRGTVQRGLTLEDGSLVVTSNYLKVRIASGRARNEWVKVRIGAADGGFLRGELVIE
jgi:tRNA A37 methylthiotransferase MiaB